MTVDHLTVATAIIEDYRSPPQYEAWGCEVSVRLLSDGQALVLCRGTDELSDWAINLWSRPARTRVGWVHKGYWTEVEATLRETFLWSDLVAVARRSPLNFGGHSKGGAQAEMLFKLCLDAGLPVAGYPVTFGAARAGWLGYRGGVRYVYGGDPVPRLPPWLPHPCPPTVLGRREAWPIVADHKMSAYRHALEERLRVAEA